MQQGGKSQRHSFQVRRVVRLYPCSITGAPELGYLGWTGITLSLQHVRPFNSEVHSASALLPGSHATVIPDRVSGSLEIALKRTRPRQRFLDYIGRDCMTEASRCQEENKQLSAKTFSKTPILLIEIRFFNLYNLDTNRLAVKK